MDLHAFMDEFKSEALEHLERIDQGLLLLEQNPQNLEQVRNLFLSAHTIKGGAAMLSLTAIKEITHAFEDILDALRQGKHLADPSTITLLLETADLLRLVVTRVPLEPTDQEKAWGKYLRLWPNIPSIPNMTKSEPVSDLQNPLSIVPDEIAPDNYVLNNALLESSVASKPQDLTLPNLPNALNALSTNKHALLLEPSLTAQLWLGWQLEQAGFTVIRCEHLEQAQKAYSEQTFTLVVAAWEPYGLQPQNWLGTLESQVLLTALVPPPFISPLTISKGSWSHPELLEWLDVLQNTARGIVELS